MKPSPLKDNTAAGFMHPEWVDGRKLWIDPEVKRIVDMMQLGAPELGWEGDPFLALYRGEGRTWVVNRYENDTYHTVCVSKPGLTLDERLIKRLVEHDLRRRTAQSIQAEVDKHNAAIEKKAEENVLEAMRKVYWQAGKDTGEGKKVISLSDWPTSGPSKLA